MAITIREAIQVLTHAPANDCVALVSAPGTGKSSAGVFAARLMGAKYWPIYAPTYEAVDARGLPMVAHGERHKSVVWAAPSCLPLDVDGAKYQGQTIFVNLDDLFQAPPPVQRAFVRSIYGDGRERRVGDFVLYPHTRFMITGNREQDRAGVYRPETYVNDRITYVEVEPSVDDWVNGAVNGFAAPEPDPEYPEMRAAIDKAVALGTPDVLIAYVKWSAQVYEFSSEQRSFLSPRSIERLGRFLRAFEVAGINGHILHEVATGTIGEAQAVKFLAFNALRKDLPDVQAILRGEDVKLPGKSEVLYILATSVVRAAKKEHVANVAKLISNMAEAECDGYKVGVEVSAYLSDVCLHGGNPALAGIRSQPTWLKWLQKNGKNFSG